MDREIVGLFSPVRNSSCVLQPCDNAPSFILHQSVLGSRRQLSPLPVPSLVMGRASTLIRAILLIWSSLGEWDLTPWADKRLGDPGWAPLLSALIIVRWWGIRNTGLFLQILAMKPLPYLLRARYAYSPSLSRHGSPSPSLTTLSR